MNWCLFAFLNKQRNALKIFKNLKNGKKKKDKSDMEIEKVNEKRNNMRKKTEFKKKKKKKNIQKLII